MANGLRITLRKLLVVEGKDEYNFFNAALANHLAIIDIQIMPIGGKTLLGATLKALKQDPAFGTVQTVAIVRDADLTAPGSVTAAAVSAFASVRAALIAAALASPNAHAQFATGMPRIGVFIMPDGNNDGMLETLCMNSVSGLPEYACINDLFVCLQEHGISSNNTHKARAHAWLASRPDPGKRVGEAGLAGYWPFGDAAFTALWNFIHAM